MKTTSRRDVLKTGLAVTGLGLIGVPDWVLPALAQGETVVPFTDFPENFNPEPAPDRRLLDVRTISGRFTDRNRFFTTQHYGHPEVDPAKFQLTVTGMVKEPLTLSLDALRKMKSADVVFGFECSGNRRPMQGLCSNGRFTGVPLRTVLESAGVSDEAREFVFFGADRGEEDVEFRTSKYQVVQQFGRSLPRETALSNEPILAYAMNGEPLTRHQGFPLRLIVPGWYGVANVKWLTDIHVQRDPFMGKWQARWYRTLRGEMIGGEMKWVEAAITRMRPKSFIARVTREGATHKILGVILNDGTPIRSIEVKVDDGAWQPATLDPETAKDRFGWKLFTYTWQNATPGEHTLVSRVTDANGVVQPTAEELESKKTFLEDNSQHPRTVRV
jgi:DMSO/TMAO reductase YedYZ molybdopterin-dependent catalytic subunit